MLVERRGTVDVFLGHGSGEMTTGQMRAKLASEYNQVAAMALDIVRLIRHSHGAARISAEAELATRFPNVHSVGASYRVQGPSLAGSVDQPLRRISASEVIGLSDPWHSGRLFTVRRPAEARP